MSKPKQEADQLAGSNQVPATSAAVYSESGGHIRTYSADVHGEGFGDLAAEFSAHTPGSTVRTA